MRGLEALEHLAGSKRQTSTIRLVVAGLAVPLLATACQTSGASEPEPSDSAVARVDDATDSPDAINVAATTLSTTAEEPTTTQPTTTQPTTNGPTITASADLDGGVDGPVAFWRFTESDEGEQALIEGPLVIEGGCTYVGLGDDRSAILWRYGTSWDAATESLVFPVATRAASGDVVRSGGGYHPLDRLDFFTSSEVVIDALARCTPSDEVFVVQSEVEILSISR